MKIVCIGNFPPRKCGIATFTENLVNSIIEAADKQKANLHIEVIAMNDPEQSYPYPEIVSKTIRQQERKDYEEAAHYINESDADLCLFQHEYGIYGGNSGLLILSLLKAIKTPVVSTFHTVLEKPNFHQLEVLKKIGEYSSKVVIMNSLAIPLLSNIYQLPSNKIIQIEHGVPDFAKLGKEIEKPINWKGKRIILTFGLLGRNKGLETVIKALPQVVEKHKDFVFVILGKTHPHVIKHAGEEYRQYLTHLAEDLQVSEYVLFENEYVSEHDLMCKLKMADIYVTPYLNKAQITSGTLVYALAGGNAVVSTPYWHAEEVLQQGRGNLFDFKDVNALAKVLNTLLDDSELLSKQKARAHQYGSKITWPKIGGRYIATFQEVLTQAAHDLQQVPQQNENKLTTKHFERLTDDTGMIQHSIASIPNFKEGYSLDDNTRAIIVSVLAYLHSPEQKFVELTRKYVAFLMYLQNPDGTFCNFLTYNRNVVNNVKPDDTFGRVIWALGMLIRYAPTTSLLQIGIDILNFSKRQFPVLNYSRGFANCILGLYHYINRFPDQEEYMGILNEFASKLVYKFQTTNEDWDWFEPILTYDNGLLPASMYAAYELTGNSIYLEVADASRLFLEEKCMINNQLSLIGNECWWTMNKGSCFAQQPVDAMAMVVLYEHAFKATRKSEYIDKLKISHAWFLGLNDLNLPLFNSQTEGCHDGLEEFEVNYNQGAESIIAYLLSDLIHKNY